MIAIDIDILPTSELRRFSSWRIGWTTGKAVMAREEVMAPMEENLARSLFMDLRMSKAKVMLRINGMRTL